MTAKITGSEIEPRRVEPSRDADPVFDADIPSEAGHRASLSPNGEVRGSGSGTGGSNPGEDYDNDEHGGDGLVSTGDASGSRGASGQGDGDH